MTLEYKTADGYTVTLSQIAQVFGVRETQSGKVADVLLTGAVLPVSILLDEHPADVAFDLEAQYEKPQADEADWFTKSDSVRNDSIISRNDWDFTPVQNMPIIDMDKIDEIPL